MTKSRRNIIIGYYCSYAMCMIRIVRYPDAIATFISPSFKNKATEVNEELFKEKNLNTLIGVGDVKDKDGNVLSNYWIAQEYYKVEYYFTLDTDDAKLYFFNNLQSEFLNLINKEDEGFYFQIVFWDSGTVKESIDKLVSLRDILLDGIVTNIL